MAGAGFADFSKHYFPTIRASDKTVSDRFDIVIIIQQLPSKRSAASRSGVAHREEMVGTIDWFPCLPFYNTVNDQPRKVIPATALPTDQVPIHMEKELFACTLNSSALQELKSLLRLTTTQSSSHPPTNSDSSYDGYERESRSDGNRVS